MTADDIRAVGDERGSLVAEFLRFTSADPEWSYLAPSLACVELDGWRTPDAAAGSPEELARRAAGPLDELRAAARDAGIGRITIELEASDSAGRRALAELGLVESVVFAERDVGPVAGAEGSVTVRLATSDDRADLVALAREEALHQALNTSAGTSPDQPPALFERIVDGWLGDGLAAVFAAVDGERIVGIAVVEEQRSGPRETRLGLPERFGYVSVVSVTRDARGRGAGGSLVRAAMGWFESRGLERAALHYVVDNAASAPFWMRHGFHPLAVTMAENVK